MTALPMPRRRDYLIEMNDRMDDATQGEWVAAVVAQQLHDDLTQTDPDLLEGWLREIAVEALRHVLAARSRSRRTIARQRAGSRRFAQAAADAEASGDSAPLLGLFETDLVVNADQLRKRAADMTGPDHLYVAERYRATEAEAKMLAAFHRAVAERVGQRRTSEVFSPEEYERLFTSITRTPPTP